MNYVILEKARPYTRVKRGRLERVKGYAGRSKRLKVMYHVAPERVQDSIKKYGIDSTKAPYERSTEGAEIYLFDTLDRAKWYKNFMSQYDEPEPFNIWKVKVDEKKLKPDYGLSSEEMYDPITKRSITEVMSWVAKISIPKNRIKLLE
jgi:hypothetical protein